MPVPVDHGHLGLWHVLKPEPPSTLPASSSTLKSGGAVPLLNRPCPVFIYSALGTRMGPSGVTREGMIWGHFGVISRNLGEAATTKSCVKAATY